ncbi:MAG: hypothetical protein NZL83_00415 [Candidatus Absconditabacterales bacterium]|nr:hypothetical protein [Candidatus Absconditabacterales bacterium]
MSRGQHSTYQTLPQTTQREEKKTLGLWIGVIGALIFGLITYLSWAAYDLNHLYYTTQAPKIFSQSSVWLLFLSSLVCASIPLMMHQWFGIKTTKGLTLTTILALCLRMLIHSSVKSGVAGVAPGAGGSILLIINTCLLVGMSLRYTIAQWSIGESLLNRLGIAHTNPFHHHLLAWGLGFGLTLITTHLLTITNLLYPFIMWIGVGGTLVLIWLQKNKLVHFFSLSRNRQPKGRMGWTLACLGVIAVWYYFFGFSHSFIPYSTAWDANHAYMYCPKVFAENGGAFFGNPCGQSPMLWYSFITFRFALIQPIKSRFRLAPDTIAVAMNFLGGILSLIVGWLVISKLGTIMTSNENTTGSQATQQTAVIFGISQLLLFLTSGMGAFLVFVDNKTDLGVFGLTLLGVWYGLEYFFGTDEKNTDLTQGWSNLDMIASAGFFVLAAMSKMTAFQDIFLWGVIILAWKTNAIVGAGLSISMVGVLASMNILASSLFIPPAAAGYRIGIGLIVAACGAGRRLFTQTPIKAVKGLFPLIRRSAMVILLLMLFKSPQLIISQWKHETLSPSSYLKGLIMGQHHTKESAKIAATQSPVHRLLASNDVRLSTDSQNTPSSRLDPTQFAERYPHLAILCPVTTSSATDALLSLPSDSVSCRVQTPDTALLFSGLLQSVGGGLNEDLQRYIGFGQRIFKQQGPGTIPVRLLRMLLPSDACIGTDEGAKQLCRDRNTFASKTTLTQWQEYYQTLPTNSVAADLLGCLIHKVEHKENMNLSDIPTQLASYRGERTIITDSTTKTIAIPHRYWVPFNISIINSLQNLSSYYTDLGFVLFLSWVLLGVALIHTIVRVMIARKNKTLTPALTTSLAIIVTGWMGWIIRWVIGSAIFWYGIGLVFRTIRGLMSWMTHTYGRSLSVRIIFLCMALASIVQFIYNGARIASQGGGGNFVWYKASVGQKQILSLTPSGFQPTNKIVIPYRQQAIFDLQFGAYNPFITMVKNRPDDHGVLIAGTYLQYFLHNQKNIFIDGLLGTFWQWQSDGDHCAVYHRLKEKKIKYLVIDPNILSIVMGDGNSSLKQRMYASLDEQGRIRRDGVVTTLVRMVQSGFLSYIYSNNLAATYALTLSDEEMRTALLALQGLSPTFETLRNDLVQTRAKWMLLRFFPEVNELYQLTLHVFEQRLSNPRFALQDIAAVYGKTINQEKVIPISRDILLAIQNGQGLSQELIDQTNNTLTQDEMIVVATYVNIMASRLNPQGMQQAQQMISQLVQQGIVGGSQLIIIERNDG